MARLFDAYMIVDWSAASKAASGADSIWIGVLKRDVRFRLVHTNHNAPTRAEAQAFIRQALVDFKRRSERVLLGFDFCLGFPRGTASALKLGEPAWRAAFDFVAKEVKDKADNTNNRFQVAAKMNRLMTGEAFPFWGCPARDEQTTLRAKRPREHQAGDLPELRHCESAQPGMSSVWKLYYQGSVGGQTLTGLPIVRALRNAADVEARLWPFETGWRALDVADVENIDVVIAEVWPPLVPAAPTQGEVKDAAQVRALAAHFAALDEAGKLGALFGPRAHKAPVDIVAEEEGWVLGV